VVESVDLETEAYLEAHGIIYDGKKLIIPAVCQYLKGKLNSNNKIEYSCMIHEDKFVNCRLAGEKECKMAKKAWELLNSARGGGSAKDYGKKEK